MGGHEARTFPPASPLMSHLHTVLSSLQLYSSLNAFHPTALTTSLCTRLPAGFAICSRMALELPLRC